MLSALVLGFLAFGGVSVFDLRIEASVNGDALSTSHVLVKDGQTGSFSEVSRGTKNFVEVVATEKKAGQIFMKFVLGHMNADGTRSVISRPQIIALVNEEAKIQVSRADGHEEILVKVLATRAPASAH